MQLSNYIDIITRAESCLEEREQDFLLALLESYEELYQNRRATRTEKTFWNQFWYSWDYPKLRDARIQAFDDMAADKYFHHISENRIVYRNFEKAIALDILRVRLQILYTLGCDFSDLHQEIFYNLQRQVQQLYESNDLPPIISNCLAPTTSGRIITPKEVEISQLVKNEVATVVAASKKETKRQNRKRLKQERKEQRLKATKEKPTEKSKKRPGYCRLQIQTPEGDYIETGNSNLTFLEFVKRVGWHNIAPLHITFEDESLFVTEEINGWYKRVDSLAVLNCRMPCEVKIAIINKICKELGLDYKPSMTKPFE